MQIVVGQRFSTSNNRHHMHGYRSGQCRDASEMKHKCLGT